MEERENRHERLLSILTVLPTDYTDYGGEVERWAIPGKDYPDCACGCRWWMPLYDAFSGSWDSDWGVCTKPDAPRSGLLTWEHQTGVDCYERGGS